MSISRQLYHYYRIQFDASHERDIQRGEVSATTVVMAAALIALAITVGGVISSRVVDKAHSLHRG